MTQKFKVLVTRKWPKKVEESLVDTFDTKLNVEDKPLSESELIEAMKSYDALLPTVTDPITDKIISTLDRRVKIIGNFGVGFNNIDIDSAKSNNVVVTNTPEVLTDCTADIAMLLLLGAARRGSEGEFHVRKKEWVGWRPTHMMGTKITDKTLGLFGMGRIAQAMAQKAHFGFRMKIIFYDPYFNDEETIKNRLENYSPVLPEISGGYQKLYVEHVMQADKGADLDFLIGKRGSEVKRHSH